jgi:hypothetical protein
MVWCRSLELVQHRIAHGPSPPLPPPDRKVGVEQQRRLLIHRLPAAKATGGAVI